MALDRKDLHRRIRLTVVDGDDDISRVSYENDVRVALEDRYGPDTLRAAQSDGDGEVALAKGVAERVVLPLWVPSCLPYLVPLHSKAHVSKYASVLHHSIQDVVHQVQLFYSASLDVVVLFSSRRGYADWVHASSAEFELVSITRLDSEDVNLGPAGGDDGASAADYEVCEGPGVDLRARAAKIGLRRAHSAGHAPVPQMDLVLRQREKLAVHERPCARRQHRLMVRERVHAIAEHLWSGRVKILE